MTVGEKIVFGIFSMIGTGAVSLLVGLSVNVHNWSWTRSERLASEKIQAAQIQQVNDAATALTNAIDKHATIEDKQSQAIDSLQITVNSVKCELQRIAVTKNGNASGRLGNPTPGTQRPAFSRNVYQTQIETPLNLGVKPVLPQPKSPVPTSSNRIITQRTQPMIIRSIHRIARLGHRVDRRDDRQVVQLAERHRR